MKFSQARWQQQIRLGACALVFSPVLFASFSAFAQQQGPPPDLSRPNGPPVVDLNQNKKPDSAIAPVPGTPGKPEAPPAAMPEVAADWTAPLRWYEGTWVIKSDQAGSKPTTEVDSCQISGKRFYECEHVVDGETVALRLYVPGDQPGHFYTQTVLPSGTALGRNDLLIEGNTWVLSEKSERDDGSLSYTRLTVVFTGKNHDTIHYTVERSDDALHWQSVATGNGRKQKP